MDSVLRPFGEISEPLPEGEYENVTLNYVVLNPHGDNETLTLTIPHLVVEG